MNKQMGESEDDDTRRVRTMSKQTGESEEEEGRGG
jgi:hypothetical protein